MTNDNTTMRPLEAELQNLEVAIDNVFDTFGGLVDRLSPVLNDNSVPEILSNVNDEGTTKDSPSVVVLTVRKEVEKVNSLAQRINNLFYRLDI